MATATSTAPRPVSERALDALRRAGNPFRNYFARNPDDEVCARYHVPELYAPERDMLLAAVDLYRYDPSTHSEVLPVLGNKGAGKTHLLHSIKHGTEHAWQLLVTPGVYQKDAEFLEYLLFQTVDTLLGGGRQKGVRPLDHIGDAVARRLLAKALADLPAIARRQLFPPQGLLQRAGSWAFGGGRAQDRCAWLLDQLNSRSGVRPSSSVRKAAAEAGLDGRKALEVIVKHVETTEGRNTAGMMRRSLLAGFARHALTGEEDALATFLTFGFAELPFNVRPSRQDLVLSLFKVVMELFRELKVPVVVAFDQLEDLLLARRADDGQRIAEAFFAGIVQAMHQLDGLCFLVFAERGLWNRFVPSLDGYIQDRLNNPLHLPGRGTVSALKLESPAADLVRRVVAARLRPTIEELPDFATLPPLFPFADEDVARIARTESTLRDMLQQFRHLFDYIVYDGGQPAAEAPAPRPEVRAAIKEAEPVVVELKVRDVETVYAADTPELPALPPAVVARALPPTPVEVTTGTARQSLSDLWDQETRSARRRLEPDGALIGAARDLQSGLGSLLQTCHENGVKVGPWRLQHVVGEWSFGDHPTYGALTIAHWACRDAQPWKVGIGLFLARGAGKPRDLEVKLSSFAAEPPMIDHLILLRPEDDPTLAGKSKTLWQDAEKRGRHGRVELVSLESFALVSSFPRWLATVRESLPAGQPLPNLADLIQDKCERLLEQVCMPVQG